MSVTNVFADHAHHQVRLTIELDGRTHDLRVPPEATLPQSITQHHHLAAVRTVFLARERASANHRRTEQREVFAADVDALHLLRMATAGEVQPRAAKVIRSDVFENAALLLPEIEFRNVCPGKIPSGESIHQLHERVRIRIGERLQQHRVNNRKDRRVHANAHCDHQHGNHREHRSLRQ